MVINDPVLAGLVNKYGVDLDTPNDVLREFVLELAEAHRDWYPVQLTPNFHVIRCYEDKCIDGRKGTSIRERDYGYILLYVGFFKSVLQDQPEYADDICKSFIMTIVHELAHQIVDKIWAFDEESHSDKWRKCAEILGLEEKYL